MSFRIRFLLQRAVDVEEPLFGPLFGSVVWQSEEGGSTALTQSRWKKHSMDGQQLSRSAEAQQQALGRSGERDGASPTNGASMSVDAAVPAGCVLVEVVCEETHCSEMQPRPL